MSAPIAAGGSEGFGFDRNLVGAELREIEMISWRNELIFRRWIGTPSRRSRNHTKVCVDSRKVRLRRYLCCTIGDNIVRLAV